MTPPALHDTSRPGRDLAPRVSGQPTTYSGSANASSNCRVAHTASVAARSLSWPSPSAALAPGHPRKCRMYSGYALCRF